MKNYTPTSNKAEWHLTLACNLACVNCNRFSFLENHPIADMILDDAHEFLRQAKELNWYPSIILIGGEPTLHSDFLEFCRISREYLGYDGLVQVWSNGSAPNAMEILQQGKDLYNISVPALTHKAKSQVLELDDIFVSPKDFGITRDSCYCHSNSICGMSVDHDGYTLCAQGGAIDSVLQLGLRTKRLADLFDPQWAAEHTKRLCEHCGNALSKILPGPENENWRDYVTAQKKKHGAYMSPTWLKAQEGLK